MGFEADTVYVGVSLDGFDEVEGGGVFGAKRLDAVVVVEEVHGEVVGFDGGFGGWEGEGDIGFADVGQEGWTYMSDLGEHVRRIKFCHCNIRLEANPLPSSAKASLTTSHEWQSSP